MDVLLEFFMKTSPYEHRALKMIIQKAGGVEQALQQPSTMQDLLDQERAVENTTQSYRGANGRGMVYYERSRRSARRGGYRASRNATYGYEPYGGYGERYRDSYHRTGTRFATRHTGSEGPSGDEDPRAAAFAMEFRALRQELADTPTAAIQKNLKIFERKFQMQQREIVEEMKKIVIHEGDRVISSVLEGPHERIIDPVRELYDCYQDATDCACQVLYEIWKDMVSVFMHLSLHTRKP